MSRLKLSMNYSSSSQWKINLDIFNIWWYITFYLLKLRTNFTNWRWKHFQAVIIVALPRKFISPPVRRNAPGLQRFASWNENVRDILHGYNLASLSRPQCLSQPLAQWNRDEEARRKSLDFHLTFPRTSSKTFSARASKFTVTDYEV